jgi:hypothetical protein
MRSLMLHAVVFAGMFAAAFPAARGQAPLANEPIERVPLAGVQGPADPAPKEPPQPFSARMGVVLPAAMPTIQAPPIDLARVLAEDAAATTGALREGVSVPLEFHPAMGDMLAVPEAAGGGWLWVVDVRAPGAYGVRVHFAEFNLPKGAMAIVYDPRVPASLPAPYTERGRVGDGEFWAWTSWSDTARVEVYYPPAVGDERFRPCFVIDQALHIYRDPVLGVQETLREFSCHNDLECYPNWVQVGACVGRMQFTLNGSGFACSGGMLNNTSSDLTPYFMTARHCMQDSTGALGSLQVYWFFQRSGCTGSIPLMSSCPRSDVASYVRTDAGTDMSLVMIEGTVPRNLWWAGNDSASMANGTYLIGIHHPGGTRKRISFGSQYDWPNSCGATGLTSGLRVDWSSGTTEPGSSGSPLFISNGAFVGVDSCGTNQCPGSGYEAVYGSWFVGYGAFMSYLNNPGPDDSYENNDTCGTATNLNSYYNGTLYSLVVKVNDEDWYRINVPAFGSCTFRAVFTHANGDIDMQLRDGCGGTIVASSTGTGDSETINWTNNSATAREVYLRVYLYNDTRNVYYLDFARYGAPAPPNDACANASTIPAGGQGSNASGNTQGANTDGSAGCQTNSAADVWFRLSAPCTRTVYLSTEGSAFDTVLSVHTGCPGTAANQVACNDDANIFAGQYWSRLSFTANGGQTYYVRIAGYNGQFGSYSFDSNFDYASNDLCQNSATLSPGTYAFNNCTCETDGPPDDVCLAFNSNQIYKDFWIDYTPTCYGTLELNTFGSTLDTKVAVYANADNSTCPPGPNSAIACNDDANGTLQSRVVVQAVANRRYVFRIGSYWPTEGGPGLLNLLFTPNNPCIPPPPCAADANQDGQITPADVASFINRWSQSLSNGTLAGDFDGNGVVEPADVGAFVNAWFSALTNGC